MSLSGRIYVGGVLAAAVIAALFSVGASAQQLKVIPPSGKWVTDNAGFLTPSEEEALSRKLSSYADTTSTQIVIVLLQSLDGAPAADYAVTLGREWGVGQRGFDNGVVILASRNDRQMFIATGYGLEGAIPDAVASRVYRNILVPNFRRGEFYAGLSEAVDALIQAARGEFKAVAEKPSSEGIDLALLLVLLILVVFLISAIRNARDHDDGFRPPPRRRRGGPPIIIWGGPGSWGAPRGGSGGFGGLGGGGFGGFGGGGGSFGGGGAGGGW